MVSKSPIRRLIVTQTQGRETLGAAIRYCVRGLGTGVGAKWVNNMMQNDNLSSMSVDELWNLHERVVVELGRKMEAERATLENRLQTLGVATRSNLNVDRPRRPYPKVLPKYRNPKDPQETWAGRGKRPRWMRAQLRLGKKLDDFLIKRSSA
jgi:DNA-binding protein H-NS